MFNRRPNIARLARRQKFDAIVRALSYSDITSVQNGRRIDLGASIRSAAARALGDGGDPRAVEPLVAIALADPDPTVRRTAVQALQDNTEPEVLIALLDGVCSWHDPQYQRARIAALTALRQTPEEMAPLLADALIARGDSDELDDEEKWAVREVIGKDEQTARAGATAMVQWLAPDDGTRARRAAGALVALAPWGEKELIDALSDESRAGAAAGVIAQRGDASAVHTLIDLLQAQATATRRAAAQALRELRDPLSTQALLVAVNDPDPGVRVAAGAALDTLGAVGVIASVVHLLTPLIERHELERVEETLTIGPGSESPDPATWLAVAVPSAAGNTFAAEPEAHEAGPEDSELEAARRRNRRKRRPPKKHIGEDVIEAGRVASLQAEDATDLQVVSDAVEPGQTATDDVASTSRKKRGGVLGLLGLRRATR